MIDPCIEATCPNCGTPNEVTLDKIYASDDTFKGLWSDMGGLKKTWIMCESCEARFELCNSVIIKGLAELMDEVILKVNNNKLRYYD